jgi:hypothetical protein
VFGYASLTYRTGLQVSWHEESKFPEWMGGLLRVGLEYIFVG